MCFSTGAVTGTCNSVTPPATWFVHSQSAAASVAPGPIPTVGVLIIGSEVNPASREGELPKSAEAKAAPHHEHADNEVPMADSGPSCTHPLCWPGPHCSPFGLSSCSQTESSPWVCLLKPEFQHPATAKEVPRVRETFLFHSAFPGVHVLSKFLFFFVLPGYVGIFLIVVVV